MSGEAEGSRQAETSLAGIGVLVTRPEAQAEHLCGLLEAAGARPIRFPVLEILDPADAGPVLEAVDRLDTYDIAIFISPNAVSKTMNFLKARREWPPGVQVAAVGRASAKALQGFGVTVDIVPPRRFDSEALLAEPALQDVAGRRIVIFRGDGGREFLGDTLRQRGAEVDYVEAYRRGVPNADTGKLMKHWARGEIDVVTVTSSEALRNLYDMVGKLGQQWIRRTPLVVLSERTAELARELGFRETPVVAEEASDEGLLAAVQRWCAGNG